MKHLFYILMLFTVMGCEVLEEDISHKKVAVVAPTDNVTVTAGKVDFRWLAVEYATGYELTVVSPSFEAAGRVAVDTVIWADTLDRRFGCQVLLAEGEYQWTVNGFNGGYITRKEVRSLTVVSAQEPEEPEVPEP